MTPPKTPTPRPGEIVTTITHTNYPTGLMIILCLLMLFVGLCLGYVFFGGRRDYGTRIVRQSGNAAERINAMFANAHDRMTEKMAGRRESKWEDW